MEEKKQGNTIDFAEAKQVRELGDEQVYISTDGEKWYPYSVEYKVDGRKFQLPFYAKSMAHAEEVFNQIKNGHVKQERIVSWH